MVQAASQNAYDFRNSDYRNIQDRQRLRLVLQHLEDRNVSDGDALLYVQQLTVALARSLRTNVPNQELKKLENMYIEYFRHRCPSVQIVFQTAEEQRKHMGDTLSQWWKAEFGHLSDPGKVIDE